MVAVKIVRRLGTTPAQRGSMNNGGCPDVFELSDGRFGVIGTMVPTELMMIVDLPEGASIASHEALVIIPRAVLVDAKEDIPDA